jgi:hypothetical protein
LNSARHLSLVTALEYLGPCNTRWVLIQSMVKWVGFSDASKFALKRRDPCKEWIKLVPIACGKHLLPSITDYYLH